MWTRHQLALASTIIALPYRPVAGQTAQPATECAAGAAVQYQRCALWLDGRRVRRGADGAVVGEPGFFSPLRLTRLVQGDSALRYAGAFERNTGRAAGFGLLGGLMAGTAFVLMQSQSNNCDPFFGSCAPGDDPSAASVALLLGSTVSWVVSAVFHRRAQGDAGRAIFWHNANFAR